MATWQLVKFWRETEKIPLIKSGDKFIACSFLQTVDVEGLVGLTGLWFVDTNLINFGVPADSKQSGCNTAINEYEEADVVIDGKPVKRYPFKKNLGKRNVTKMVKSERALVLASTEVTDKFLRKEYAKEIKNAKASLERGMVF